MLNFDTKPANQDLKGIMNYLQTFIHSFIRLRNLLFSTTNEWEIIALENKKTNALFFSFAFPIIAFSALLSFVGIALYSKSWGIGISQFFVTFLALNIGLFVSAKIIQLLTPNFQIQVKDEKIFQLIIYSASIFCLFHGMAKLFLTLGFLHQICLVLKLYFIRALWQGSKALLPLHENKRPSFIIMASLLVIVIPIIFERLFSIIFNLPVTI